MQYTATVLNLNFQAEAFHITDQNFAMIEDT